MRFIQSLLKILFWYIIAPFSSFISTLKLFYNSRVLLINKNENYKMFHSKSALEYFFYDIIAINLSRFGLNGISNTLSTGNYKLKNFFYIPRFSINLFWKYSNLYILSTYFLIAISFLLIYIIDKPNYISLIVLYGIFFSTFSLGNINSNNYNYLAWAFIPFFLYTCIQPEIPLYVIILTLIVIAFLSITVYVFSMLYSFPLFLISGQKQAVIYMLIFGFIHAILTFRKFNFSDFISILKLIGLKKQGVKYKRTDISFNNLKEDPTISFLFIILIGLFITSQYLQNDILRIWTLISVVICVVHFFIARFADTISVNNMIVFAVSISFIESPSILYIPFIYFLFYPLPTIAALVDNKFFKIKELSPFYIKDIVDTIGNFISKIEPGDKILLVNKNPGLDYSKIYDGYREYTQPLFYVGNKLGVNIIPDWWAIGDDNIEGTENKLWANTLSELNLLLSKEGYNYFILYEQHPVFIDVINNSQHFEKVSELDWRDLIKLNDNSPKWVLFKKVLQN